MKLRTSILLALALSGCGTSYCFDAPADDAGIGAPQIPTDELCNAFAAERAEACGLECPFAGERCDEARVLRCIYLLEVQGGDCTNDTSILRSADCTEACR